MYARKIQASPHSAGGSQRDLPIISIDYAFLGVKPEDGSEYVDDVEAIAAGHTPTMVMFDSESRGMYAYSVEKKGINGNLARRIAIDLDNLGYKDLILKSDQEASIVSMGELIKKVWSGNMGLEYSHVKQSQCNGSVERAIKTWKGQVRTMLDALECRVGEAMPPNHAIMSWLIEHAASLTRRCLMRADGQPPPSIHEGESKPQTDCRIRRDGVVPPTTKTWRPRGSADGGCVPWHCGSK